MRLPTRLGITRTAALVALLSVGAMIDGAIPATAGPAPSLCHMSKTRGAIPSSFAVDACFDGTKLMLRNSIDVALGVITRGDVGRPSRLESDVGLAALATRAHSHDPNLFLPGDLLRFPIGPGAASARLAGSSTAFYALAHTVAEFIPGKPNAVLGAFTGLSTELAADMAQYRDCLVGKNWLGQLGCQTLQTRNVSFAVGRAGFKVGANAIVGAILSGATFAVWANAQPGQIKAILHSGSIRLSPVPPDNGAAGSGGPPTHPATPPTPAPPPTTQQAPPPLAIGSPFDDKCVVAWPTAPVRTSASIEMTMSCAHVPESTYLFTQVTYDDPNLPITPSTGTIRVQGRVVDVAKSEYGFNELVVQASSVELP